MPNYTGAVGTFTAPPYGPPTKPAGPVFLAPQDSVLLFNAEQPAVPQASQEISVAVPADAMQAGAQPQFGLELQFSGPPGVFDFEIQEADTNGDNFFKTPSAAAFTITAVDANNFARVDLQTGSRFLRGLLKSRANAVTCTARLTRIA